MPHLTLEYTANLGSADVISLLRDLNQVIAEAAGIRIENFKSRAIRWDLYLVGAANRDEGFVHLEVALFRGRAQAIKDQIGRQSLAILDRYFGRPIDGPGIQITVEIRDIDREVYFKRPEGISH